jgi:hypothetical protein
MINYVLVTITASVLAYATAMDIDENANDGSATDNLPSFDYAKEPEPEPEPEQDKVEEPEPVEEPELEPAEEVPMAEAQVVPQAQPEKGGPAFGGKRNARKIKKTIRNAHNNKKHKQTRNKNHRK